MTVSSMWVSPTPVARGVHVLVIGVGEYEAQALPPLSGAAHSAARVAMWWAGAGPAGKLLAGQELASIEVLLSAAPKPLIEMPDGSVLEPGDPTLDTVSDALRRWIDLSLEGELAILHWIGHGVIKGLDGEGIQHGLYCYDLDRKTLKPKALGWTQTRWEIDERLGSKAMCFIDTCQTHADKSNEPELEGVWSRKTLGALKQAYVYYGAGKGQEARTRDVLLEERYPPQNPARGWRRKRGCFGGGSVFSEAILCALDGIGAMIIDQDLGYAVYGGEVKRVIDHRLAKWMAQHSNDFGDWVPSPKPDFPASWNKRPLVRAPNPASNVTVRLEEPRAAAGLRLALDFGIEDRPDGYRDAEHWNIDLDHGDYIAVASGRQHDGAPLRTFEGAFRAVYLEHDVTLREKGQA